MVVSYCLYLCMFPTVFLDIERLPTQTIFFYKRYTEKGECPFERGIPVTAMIIDFYSHPIRVSVTWPLRNATDIMHSLQLQSTTIPNVKIFFFSRFDSNATRLRVHIEIAKETKPSGRTTIRLLHPSFPI